MNLKYDDFGKLEKLDVYMVSQDMKSKVPIQIHNIKIEMRDLEISKVTFDVDEEESIIRDLYTWEKYEGTTWEELAGLTWLDITRSKDYTLFESLRIIHIPALGDKAYFQLSTPSETQENKRNYKSCTAYSLEYQLTQKDVSYFIINMGTIGSRDGIVLYDKINPDKSLLDLALKNAPNWSVGEVDTSIALKSRSFEIDKSDIYSFLVDDVADAYKCVFLFDTVNCKVNVVALENYGKDTDIHISSKNLAKRIAIESAEDSIFTRFYVEGKDGLDIRDVNLGSDYIEDYSYYNSPEWLGSQELCDKYNDYIGLREMQRALYINKQKENINKLNQYHELMNRVPDNFDSMIWAEYGLIELRTMRDTYQNVVDSQIENGHDSPSHINHDAYLINKKALGDIKAELIVRENEVNVVQLALDNIAIELKQIIDVADKNTYFTKDELIIFSSLEVNTDYSDESYVTTDSMPDEMVMQIKEDLYTSAVKEIYISSHPQYSFKTELLNLFNIPEFKPIKAGFDLGSFITLSMRETYHARLRLIAIDIDFNNLDSLTVEFSNMTRSRDGFDDYMALVKNAINRTSASITRSLNTSMIGVHEELSTIESIAKKGVSYEYLFANYASFGTLEAVNAKIYNLETTYLTAEQANILFLTVEQADIKYGNVEELTADVADIKTLLAGNITADNIKAGTITAESAIIADAAITRANIGLGVINSALIEDGAIGTVQIADGSITDAKIVELTANKITAGTLSVERLIIRDAVNPDQSLIYQINNIDGALQSVSGDTLNGEILTERSITADRIVAEAITANEIAANAITTNKILANAITADKILADSILARHIKAGEITVNHVNSDFGATLDLSSNTAIRSQVSKDNIISSINQSTEEISIEANKVTIGTGTNFERGETYTWEKYAGITWREIAALRNPKGVDKLYGLPEGTMESAGRNYVTNEKINNMYSLNNTGWLNTAHEDCPNGFYSVNNADETYVFRMDNAIDSNGYWTVSFDIRGSQATSASQRVSIADSAEVQLTTTSDNSWKRVFATFNINGYDGENGYLDFRPAWAYLFVRNLKLEKTTPWLEEQINLEGRNLLNSTSSEWRELQMGSESPYVTFFHPEVKLEVGETYTFSIIIDKVSTDDTGIRVDLGLGTTTYQKGFYWSTRSEPSGVKMSFTHTITESNMDIYKGFFGWRLNNNYQPTTIRYKEVKLEKGNKATPWNPALEEVILWTPAPEDIEGVPCTWLEASRSPEYSPALISRTLEKISASLGSMEYFDESAFYGETVIVGGFLNTNLIMANSIVANHIASGAITADKIQAGAITADKIQAGAITADMLGVTSLSAISSNLGTITSGSITGTVINNGNGTFRVDANGNLTATNADIKGKVTATSGSFTGSIASSSANITGGTFNVNTSSEKYSAIRLTHGTTRMYLSPYEIEFDNAAFRNYIGLGGIDLINQSTGQRVALRYNPGASPPNYGLTVGNLQVENFAGFKDINVTGTKNRVVDTPNYGRVLLNAYETPKPTFADTGHAQIGDDGLCYIDIDLVFLETIDHTHRYRYFLTKYGQGDLWIRESNTNYFVVEGTPNLNFDWKIEAVQRDYNTYNLEQFEGEGHGIEEIDYVSLADEYLRENEKEMIIA